MAVNKSVRDALVALRAFMQTIETQYEDNLALLRAPRKLFSSLGDDWRAFDADGLAAAQIYSSRDGTRFLLLASVDETSKIVLEQTEDLLQLANEAVALDTIAAAKGARRAGLAEALELCTERVITRAAFMRCLLGVYVRAAEADLINRLVAEEITVYTAAHAGMKRGVEDLTAALEKKLPLFAFPKEMLDYAQTMRFPMLPLAVGSDRAEGEVVNGVVLSPELAQQHRDRLAALQVERARKSA